jgi:penicillin-binding protein 1C
MALLTPLDAPAGRPRIATPAPGATYAVDPDIPQGRQRIALAAKGVSRGSVFLLDDGRRVRADTPYLWLAAPGRRQVALIDGRGRELDRVRFDVRTLPRRAAPAPASP